MFRHCFCTKGHEGSEYNNQAKTPGLRKEQKKDDYCFGFFIASNRGSKIRVMLS